MADTVKVLNRTAGLLDNTSPTGCKYKIVDVEWNNALKRIVASSGPTPSGLSGLYTSTARAQNDITQFLKDRWDDSDDVAAKNKAKRA